jgi:hypothetical protein
MPVKMLPYHLPWEATSGIGLTRRTHYTITVKIALQYPHLLYGDG